MNEPFLINIEEVPWQLCMLNKLTDEEAYAIIGTKNWYPEFKNYFGIVCYGTLAGTMVYEFFSTAEEGIAFTQIQLDTDTRYFLLRQMTEEEVNATLERIKYNRLLQEGQIL